VTFSSCVPFSCLSVVAGGASLFGVCLNRVIACRAADSHHERLCVQGADSATNCGAKGDRRAVTITGK